MYERLLAIGIGNQLRGDDAAGLAVVRRLRGHPGIDARELQGEPITLLDAWSGYRDVVVIDTMRSGAPAGTIRRIDLRREPLPLALRGSTSTHAMGLREALELARELDRLPARIVVYAVEGRRFDTGAGLSEEVSAGIDELVTRVLGERTSRSRTVKPSD